MEYLTVFIVFLIEICNLKKIEILQEKIKELENMILG